jgi:hypothetical protein
MKILCGNFNAKVGRENIFTPTIRNESPHQDNNDSGVREVNFSTSRIVLVKSKMSPTKKFLSTSRSLLNSRHATKLSTYCWIREDFRTHSTYHISMSAAYDTGLLLVLAKIKED